MTYTRSMTNDKTSYVRFVWWLHSYNQLSSIYWWWWEEQVSSNFFLSLFLVYMCAPDANKLIDKHRERETPNTLYHYLSFTYVSTYADMLISLLWKTRPEEFNTNELCVCVRMSAWMRTSSINMTTYTLKRFMPFRLITWSSLRDMIRVYSLWCVDRYCRVR
jgi:hypothetical protein